MKRLFLLSILASLVTSTVFAQDDLYFVPSKKDKEAAKAAKSARTNTPVYHSGSNRNVDEYNRRGAFASHYDFVGTDSTGNDIIEFTPGTGVYPDSIPLNTLVAYNDSISALSGADAPRLSNSGSGSSIFDDDNDYFICRRLSRFDDFYGPYWAWNSFHSPWYYDPWFGPYHTPWHYNSWYYSWYDPWFSPYYDPWFSPYYDPWYWHGGWGSGFYHHWYAPIVVHHGPSGTRNHGSFSGHRNGMASNSRSISRGVQSRDHASASTQSRGTTTNLRRSNVNHSNNNTRNYQENNRSYNETRSYTPSYNSNTSRSSFGGSGGNVGGGSVGGSRGGGFSGSFRGRR